MSRFGGIAMRATLVLAFLMCLTLPLFSQQLGKSQAEAQCKFSDGNTVKVTHIPERKTYELATAEDLLTVKGMSIPAGQYTVLPTKDPRNGSWTLKMRSESTKGESRELPPVPMSINENVAARQFEPSGFSGKSSTVSFDQTGGSCMMHWRSQQPNLVLSLEFTEKNTDLPVEQ